MVWLRVWLLGLGIDSQLMGTYYRAAYFAHKNCFNFFKQINYESALALQLMKLKCTSKLKVLSIQTPIVPGSVHPPLYALGQHKPSSPSLPTSFPAFKRDILDPLNLRSLQFQVVLSRWLPPPPSHHLAPSTHPNTLMLLEFEGHSWRFDDLLSVCAQWGGVFFLERFPCLVF